MGKKVKHQKQKCENCGGSGKVGPYLCGTCGGKGKV